MYVCAFDTHVARIETFLNCKGACHLHSGIEYVGMNLGL
jgi:hypothetical protein